MAPISYKYSEEEKQNILETAKKYLEEAMKGEEELLYRYKKLVLIVDKEDYIIFEKLRGNKHRTVFFRELLEAYYSIYFLKNNLYENKEIKIYNEAIKKNVELADKMKGNEEMIRALIGNIVRLRLKILDEIEFWLGDLYKQSSILQYKSTTGEIWKNKI
ncbi:MAG: hypothetical protein ACK4YO_03215 [Candidatus Altarchaeaceae archaeon]